MSAINPKYEILFTPFKIGGIEIKNRFQMAGMGGNDEVSTEGACAPNAVEYYVERARGGIGIVTTGTMTILERPKYKSVEILLTEDIDPETFARTFGHMNDRIHAYGAKSMIQLSLGTSKPQLADKTFSPSVIVNDFTKEDFAYFVERYRIMSKAAKDAGFDIIEVHAVHTGYIFDQLATAASNHRTDEYGGSVENRTRLMGEVRRAIAESCGEDYPVSIKLGAVTDLYVCEKDPDSSEMHVKVLRREVDETVELAKQFEKQGYNVLDIDDVGTSGPFEDIRKYSWKLKAIKDAVSIPVIGSGRLYDPDISSEYVREGIVDAVCMGRQSFADPDYVNKLRCNRYDDIRFCLACNQGCINRNIHELTVKCAINASAGRETATDLAPLRKKKSVLIAGGGPAGMEAARVAASRGHAVTLYERGAELGGDFIPATAFPFRKWGRHLIGWYRRQLDALDMKIVTGKEITAEDIERESPDAVVVAVGADEFVPRLKGIDDPKVIRAIDYIMNDKKERKNVIVIGGGMTGCEIAMEDAQDGKTVTLVEMQDKILSDPSVDYLTKKSITKCMNETSLRVLEKTRLVEINETGAVVDGPNGTETIPADVIVMAVGFKPRTGLFNALQNYAGEVYNLGNSKKVGNICDAIWAAYEVGNGI